MLTNLGDQIPYGEVRAVTSPEELKLLRALIGALASLVYRLLLLLPLPQEEIRKPEAVPGAAAEYRRAFRKSRRDHRKKAGGKPCP